MSDGDKGMTRCTGNGSPLCDWCRRARREKIRGAHWFMDGSQNCDAFVAAPLKKHWTRRKWRNTRLERRAKAIDLLIDAYCWWETKA